MTISATTQGLRPGVCTSTNRPAVPFDGMLIYETDTDLVRSYNGTSWVTVGPTTPVVKAINDNTIATSQTTASATFTDLATVGPTVTVTTGTLALVIIQARHTCNTNTTPRMGFSVSGATTIAASDALATSVNTVGADGQSVFMSAVFEVILTAGSNTFTAKYRSGNTATFADRSLYVVTL